MLVESNQNQLSNTVLLLLVFNLGITAEDEHYSLKDSGEKLLQLSFRWNKQWQRFLVHTELHKKS